METPKDPPYLCPYCGGEVDLEGPLPSPSHVFGRVLRPRAGLEDMRCPQCGQFLWFTVKRLGEATVLIFLPGTVFNTLDGVRVNDALSAIGGDLRVVADLSHFDVIPSFMLGTLVTLHLRLAKAGGRLKLCGLRPEVLAGLKVTNLDRVLDICDDEANALANF